MKKEWADKWVAALRSGKYKQGRNRLKSIHNEYCCLGVLCDLVDSTKWTKIYYQNITRKFYYQNEAGCLPDSISEITGIHDRNATIASIETNLISLNDAGATFEEISNVIEKHWKEL